MSKIFPALLITVSMLCAHKSKAQNGQESIAYTPDSVKHINRSCEYPGKMEGLLNDIQKKLVIPKTVKQDALHGKIFLRLTINQEGLPGDAFIVKGVRDDIDNAVLEVSGKLKRFEPATMDGKKVNTSILIPITF